MKRLVGLAMGQGKVEAEFTKFPRQSGSKASAVGAVEMISPRSA